MWRYVPSGAVMTKPKPKPFDVESAGKLGAESEVRCSFCWKPRNAVRHLVEGAETGLHLRRVHSALCRNHGRRGRRELMGGRHPARGV
jgi:hypothetical protein